MEAHGVSACGLHEAFEIDNILVGALSREDNQSNRISVGWYYIVLYMSVILLQEIASS
jgi:hypothetical protein